MFIYEQRNNSSDIDERIDANGFEYNSSGVIVDGNKVYYNHHHFHGSSNLQLSQRISNGNHDEHEHHSNIGGTKYALHKQSNAHASAVNNKENKCETSMSRDDGPMADGVGYNKYTAGSHDGTWKKRQANNDGPMKNASKKLAKSYANEHDSESNEKRYDTTMFPFDRAAIAYEDQDSGGSGSSSGGLERRKSGKYRMHASNNSYYDSSSPENDSSYEQSSHRKSDGRQYKEMTIVTRKKQHHQQQQQQSSAKLSKYDSHKSSMPGKKDHHHSQNHISDPDAFTTIITTADATTTITTKPITKTNPMASGDCNAIQYDSHTNTHCYSAKDHNNLVSQFEQIASKFDKMPPKTGQTEAFRMHADIHESASVLSLHMHANPCKLTLSQPAANANNDPYAPTANTSPVPDLRVDFFAEPHSEYAQKRHSFVEIHLKQALPNNNDPSSPKSVHSCNATITTAAIINSAGINVTSNPMDDTSASACATSQTPRATIVVQQVNENYLIAI